jgi:hypothetical protein
MLSSRELADVSDLKLLAWCVIVMTGSAMRECFETREKLWTGDNLNMKTNGGIWHTTTSTDAVYLYVLSQLNLAHDDIHGCVLSLCFVPAESGTRRHPRMRFIFMFCPSWIWHTTTSTDAFYLYVLSQLNLAHDDIHGCVLSLCFVPAVIWGLTGPWFVPPARGVMNQNN